jgi:hypothetical protein
MAQVRPAEVHSAQVRLEMVRFEGCPAEVWRDMGVLLPPFVPNFGPSLE